MPLIIAVLRLHWLPWCDMNVFLIRIPLKYARSTPSVRKLLLVYKPSPRSSVALVDSLSIVGET